MKTANAGVIALLAGKQFYIAEVYTITLNNGSILYYTSLDVDVAWNSHTYSSSGVLIQRSKLSQTRGVEVAELEIKAYPTTLTIGGIGLLAAAVNGVLDGATVKLERLFYSAFPPGTPVGGITLFSGQVSDIEIGRTYLDIKVKSIMERLQIDWPRLTYQPSCVWTLYDGGCTLPKASWTVTNTVKAGTLLVSQFTTNLSQADGYFNQGVITFTSGYNTGIVRTIKSYLNANGMISLVVPLPYAPIATDAFSVYPGCDHLQATCNTKFSNLNNFRAFPYIPCPETSL